MWALYRVIYFISFFLFFQLLKLFSRDSQAAPHFGFNPTSSLPCLRLKYRNTQRTTSPVIIFLFCSFSLLLFKSFLQDLFYLNPHGQNVPASGLSAPG